MERYEINKYYTNFREKLLELNKAIDIINLKKEVSDLMKLTIAPNFYVEMNNAQKTLKKIKDLNGTIKIYDELLKSIDELEIYIQMLDEGENVLETIKKEISQISKQMDKFEIMMLLSKEYDNYDAIVELHPGAGGTEAQDWAEMLFRMYSRYAEQKGFDLSVIDYQDGEEAGLKSVTFLISGNKAYGYLKSEQGIHRLVRISPFDSNARRHTSFCACSVIPKIDDNIDIEIRSEDIRIDTFRASGAGGQHVNTTDSAVRITHLKTGIVVSCQNERSQIQNREVAFNILKSKLYQLQVEKQEKELSKMSDNVINSFGSQIRSYVFHPYSMVKDHRTNYETGNSEAVMDGDIDGFINAYLISAYNLR
ncbi:MAG TPA: peptide chain release factor 2 [Acholeplasmataceae bacterium]|nr:peptide chain release factor 2 [Acholeplasmataceae bacterium]